MAEDKENKFKRVEQIENDDVFLSEDSGEWSDVEMKEGEDGDVQESDASVPHLVRVGKTSNPSKLSYHIVRCIQQFGIAETQSIGPQALSKALLAIVGAESIVSQYTTCEKLCIIPCIRKPTMRNGEERTAIRLRIVPVHIQHLR